MNNLTDMISAYKPERYTSIDVDLIQLKTTFKLSPRGAFILKQLLSEYKVHHNIFGVSGIRQLVLIMRKAIRKKIGQDAIVSLGMGFYTIPDDTKEIIRDYMGKTYGGDA